MECQLIADKQSTNVSIIVSYQQMSVDFMATISQHCQLGYGN